MQSKHLIAGDKVWQRFKGAASGSAGLGLS